MRCLITELPAPSASGALHNKWAKTLPSDRNSDCHFYQRLMKIFLPSFPLYHTAQLPRSFLESQAAPSPNTDVYGLPSLLLRSHTDPTATAASGSPFQSLRTSKGHLLPLGLEFARSVTAIFPLHPQVLHSHLYLEMSPSAAVRPGPKRSANSLWSPFVLPLLNEYRSGVLGLCTNRLQISLNLL